MALPDFTMLELVEAGVHFGHKTKRWNPQMAPFIYGSRNDIHIIDLQKTVPLLHNALLAVRDVARKNGRILFVGTKRPASIPVAEAAKRCGQYYVNKRWLGGMLTNWNTIQDSIKRLRKLEETLDQDDIGLTKKEILALERQRDKLEKSLGGIKDMGGIPDLIFMIDTNREELAVKEAARLGIPVIAVLDSNSSLEHVTYPVPGNDDASRAIKLYCRLISDAALDGLQEAVAVSGQDIGASENVANAGISEAIKMTEEQVVAKEKPASRRQEAMAGKEAKKAPAVVVKKSAPKMSDKTEDESASKEDKAAAETVEESSTESSPAEAPAGDSDGEKKAAEDAKKQAQA